MLEQCIDVLTSHKIFREVPEEFDDLVRHFHRMKYTFNRGGREFSNDDFYSLGIKDSTSLCVVKNLEYPFDIYNSDRYLDGTDKYKVKSIGNKQTIITTKRHPYIEDEEELKENKQASISQTEEGNFEVKINNEYVGIIRRFAIVISTKKPVIHYGMYAIATSAGNKLFVYACDFDSVNYKDDKVAKKLGVWGSSAVILGFGYTNQDLEKRLVEAKDFFDKHCDGRCAILIKPTEKFEEGTDWNDDPYSSKSSKSSSSINIEFD